MKEFKRIVSSMSAPVRGALVCGLGLLLVGLLAGGAAASSSAVFTPDGAASELMRLLNGERTAAGLPTLEVDPFLAVQARDGAINCPNGAGTMEGRAKDMALNGFFSHALRICGTDPAGDYYDVLDVMPSWGYASSRGENIAMNRGYDFEPFPYQFGCDVHQANCSGPNTTAPTTVAIASRGFMTSQGHRDLVLSTYVDRFACGAWSVPWPDYPGEVQTYYACLFAYGPGTREAPTPTPTPEPTPTPTPTPTPGPTPVPDATAPSVTSLSAPAVVSTTNRSFVAAWSATDDRAVTGYVVWIRKGSGAWSEQPAQTATSRTFKGLSSGTWHVGVRARDGAGNWSEFRQTAVLVPTDDRAWAFTSGNARRTGSSFVNGTDTRTSRAGAKMTIRFHGSSFVLIGTTAVGHGRLRVVIDGKAYTIDEGYYRGSRATGTHYRVVLLNKTLTNKAHTVVITCLATRGRPTIDVDAVAWRN